MKNHLNLPRNNPVIGSNEQVVTFDKNILSPLKVYPSRLKAECDKYNEKIADYNPLLIEPFYEYLRFNSDLSVFFAPVQRNDLVEILKDQDSDLCSLLDKTDLCNIFPDKFFLEAEESYVKLPRFLKEKISLEDIIKFKKTTKNNFVIPSLSFLSFFIKDGETLRKYTQVIGDVSSSILFLSKTIKVKKPNTYDSYKKCLSFNNFYFDLGAIKKFYDSTRVEKIEAMVEDTSTLLEEINVINESYENAIFSGKRQINRITIVNSVN